MSSSSKRRVTATVFLILAAALLNISFINCTGKFSSSNVLSSTSQASSTPDTSGDPNPGSPVGGGGTTPDPTPIPKGPLPPVPPDVLPAAITPAWFGSHAVGEWFAIPNSVHAGSPAAPTDDPNDVYCLSTRRLSYSNIAQKGAQIILAATGGHSDYNGNEVTGIDLSADAPAWKLLHAGTPDAQKIPDVPYFADGLPNSRHTYNTVFFSTTRNRLVLHRSRFMWASATSDNATNGFNLDNNTWDPKGTFNPGTSAMARDSHDNVWAYGNYFDLYKWTATTDTWVKTASFANQIGYGMAHDSRRDQMFQLSWGDGQGNGTGVRSAVYNMDGTTQTLISFQDSAAYRQFQADMPANDSLVYDPPNDRFLFWDGVSGRLYQIIPNSTTTWDMSIVGVTGTLPPAASNSYGRMAYVPSLRGIVVMPAGHKSLYFLRLN